MIKEYILKDFKIHSDLSIELGNITILTGQNGMGKSSVMQSLLLLRQSISPSGEIMGVNLKGELTDLGSASDVECQSCNDRILNMELYMDNGQQLHFGYSYFNAKPVDTFLPSIKDMIPDAQSVRKCSLFTRDFQYISAFRLGPQRGYSRDTNIVQYQGQISKYNGQCEYAVHFLSHYGKEIHCEKDLLFDYSTDDLLENQVELWMQQVSPRVSIRPVQDGADFKLNYKFTREGSMSTDEMSAVNVGYGVTYVLPIVIAVLSAKPGALIMIENPEAHIHPRAQAELMKLLMKAANAGIQIIIETHSDHIMNGALVSVANNPESVNMVKAYYFERNDSMHTSVAKKLNILKDGRIDNPPRGFFDQMDIDMRKLMGF